MFRKGIDTKDAFIQHIREKFKKLEKNNKLLKELAITDTYMLKQNDDFEHPLFLLNSCLKDAKNLKKVTLLVHKKHLKVKTQEAVCKMFNEMFLGNTVQKIDVIFDSDFHDRFWFINQHKAFIVGASLNAIGSKHFFVQDNYFKRKDVKVLLDLCFNKDNYDLDGIKRELWCYEKQHGFWNQVVSP